MPYIRGTSGEFDPSWARSSNGESPAVRANAEGGTLTPKGRSPPDFELSPVTCQPRDYRYKPYTLAGFGADSNFARSGCRYGA
jgi:hypothetical protein